MVGPTAMGKFVPHVDGPVGAGGCVQRHVVVGGAVEIGGVRAASGVQVGAVERHPDHAGGLVDGDPRQHLGVGAEVVVDPHRSAPGGAVVRRGADEDVEVVALVGRALLGVHQVDPVVAGPAGAVPGEAGLGVDRPLGLGGRTSDPPTLVVVAVTAAPKPPAPSPSASVWVKMPAGPWPPVGLWYVTITSPVGPMAMSPKLPTAETSCSAFQAPNVSGPVTLRPRAAIPPESSRHVTQTEPRRRRRWAGRGIRRRRCRPVRGW